MVDSLNDAYGRGKLSNCQREAIITLIDKKDKIKGIYPIGEQSR